MCLIYNSRPSLTHLRVALSEETNDFLSFPGLRGSKNADRLPSANSRRRALLLDTERLEILMYVLLDEITQNLENGLILNLFFLQ